ncbi:MAG: MFS transporter [Pseudomonadota bacterium]|nr:MFS transporter [Pseudomonadota bacterium]
MREIDIGEEIDARPLGGLQWLALILCSGVALLDGFDVQIIAHAGPVLSRELAIPAARLGLVFSSGLVGMTLGLLILSPFADRFGRKRTIELSVLLFGVFTLLTAFVRSFEQLLILRVLAGLGLGGALPNIVVLMTEFTPRRLRNLTVAAVFLGFPLGGMASGLLAGQIIPTLGWRPLFLIGGVLPLLLLVVLLRYLPESPRFLLGRGATRHAALHRLLNRMGVPVDTDARVTMGEDADQEAPRLSVRRLFDPGYVLDTLRLWLIFFVNLMAMYMLISWIPSLLVQSGYDFERAAVASVYLNLGGAIGPFALAWIMARVSTRVALGGYFLSAALCVLLIGQFGQAPALVLALTFLAGFFVFGNQVGINVLATNTYPTAARSTGVGWALGIGRVGTILGPLITGALVQLQLGMPVYFGVFAAALLVAGVTIATIRSTGR